MGKGEASAAIASLRAFDLVLECGLVVRDPVYSVWRITNEIYRVVLE
jgi:hypothetical protein